MNDLELCDECGFDSRDWRVYDVGTLFDALGYWWRLALAGASAPALNSRPRLGVWSVLEYGLHSAVATALVRAGAEMILDADGCTLPAVPESPSSDTPLVLDVDDVLSLLEREGALMAALTHRRGGWDHVGHHDGSPVRPSTLVVHAAHDASHHFMDVARGLPSASQRGTVAQINVSDGGVPKTRVAVGSAVVERRGLDGDRQADRKHHGRPFQAVCLWSTEVIEALAAEGHPIAAGSAGENLTVSGLDWSTLRPAMPLQVGTVSLELSYPAVPCAKQTRWFTDGDFDRISHDRNPHLARWYAWVRQPGVVRAGDEVILGSSGGGVSR